MATEIEQLMQRWFEEVWNQGNLNTIDELFAVDGIAYGLGELDHDVHGPAAFKPFVQRLRGAFPDIHFTVDDIIEQGDKVAARFSVTMTHLGDDLGFPATGRPVKVKGITYGRIQNGQLIEGWNVWDIHGMMQQLQTPPNEVRLLAD